MAIKKSKESYGDLFIPMHDVSEKRKHLLLSMKNSLVMQEEYEKILMIRANKAEILSTIKKGMTSLNSDYSNLKKHFPNVKNVLSNTEKEINILESQINLLKNSNVKTSDDILKKIEIEQKLGKVEVEKQHVEAPVVKKSATKPLPKEVKKAPVITKPLTKKERVKANLKSIESKLNNL
jgi:chromosome segregation ATPase